MAGRWVWALLAVAFGFAANVWLPVPGPFGLDLLLGGVFAYVIVLFVGNRPVTHVMAIIIFAGQWVYWGHPLTAAISYIEFAFILLLSSRFMMLGAAVLFSLTLGPALSYVAYGQIIGMPDPVSLAVNVKNSLGTIICIGLGSLAYCGRYLFTATEKIPVREFYRMLLVPLVLTPLAMSVFFEARERAKDDLEDQQSYWSVAVQDIVRHSADQFPAAQAAMEESLRFSASTLPGLAQAERHMVFLVDVPGRAILSSACVSGCDTWARYPQLEREILSGPLQDEGMSLFSPAVGQGARWTGPLIRADFGVGDDRHFVGLMTTDKVVGDALGQLRFRFYVWMALFGLLLMIGWVIDSWALRPLAMMTRAISDASADEGRSLQLPKQVFAEVGQLRTTIEHYASRLNEAHARAKELDEQLSLIAERAPMVFATWRMRSRYGLPELVSCSARPEERLGLTSRLFENPRCAAAFVHPEDRPAVSQLLADLRDTSHAGAEFRMMGIDGQWRWLLLRFSRRVLDDGTLELIGVITDASQANFTLDHRTHRERLAMMGRMIGGLAHELNQPLNVISMAAGNIAHHATENLSDRSVARDYIVGKTGKMLEQVDRANRLLKAMESVSLRNGFTRRPVGLPKLVRECLQAMADAGHGNIRLEIYGHEENLSVAADAEQLKTVIMSVLLNAVEATEAARLESPRPDPRPVVVEIHTMETLGLVRLGIRDFGGGFEESEIPYLFTPFASESQRAEGSGLSLAKCFSIIREMDAEIYAKNHGSGALVTIYFPSMARAPD